MYSAFGPNLSRLPTYLDKRFVKSRFANFCYTWQNIVMQKNKKTHWDNSEKNVTRGRKERHMDRQTNNTDFLGPHLKRRNLTIFSEFREYNFLNIFSFILSHMEWINTPKGNKINTAQCSASSKTNVSGKFI